MSHYDARKHAAQQERRRNARFLVDLEAQFRSIAKQHRGRLSNISEKGAKVTMDGPPREGIVGWLGFAGQDIFCRVVWATTDACGVEFERPLPESVLVAIAGDQANQCGPVANTVNIPMGRKRGGRLVTNEG